MPIRAGWYIKNHVFVIQGKGDISDEEFLMLGNSPILIQALDDSPASVLHYIFDLVDPQAKLPSLRVRGKSRLEKHPKDGWSMFLNFKLNPLWRMTATILAQVSQGRFRFLDTYDDTLMFLRRVDNTLPAQPDSAIEWLLDLNWTAQPANPVGP